MLEKTEVDFTVMHELPRLIERLQRRYHDLLAAALPDAGGADISPAQFTILLYLQNGEVSVRELTERGYYLGSNASYNIKHLTDGGYVERTAALRDKRAVRLKLTAKSFALVAAVREREREFFKPLLAESGSAEAVEVTYKFLRTFENRVSESLRLETADLVQFIE